MDEPRFPRGLKKGMLIASAIVAVVLIVVSAFMLVRNAKLEQTEAKTTGKPKNTELRVVPSEDEVLSASTGTEATGTLQGSTGAEAKNSNVLPATDKVEVNPLPPVQQRVCDTMRKASLIDAYDKSKASENSYHARMVSLLSLESVLLQSSEETRHSGELAKLETSLTKSLTGIFCTL